DRVHAQIVTAVGNHGPVRDDAYGAAPRCRDPIAGSGAAGSHRMVRAAVVVDLDEFVVRSTRTSDTKFTDQQLSGCGSHRWLHPSPDSLRIGNEQSVSA